MFTSIFVDYLQKNNITDKCIIKDFTVKAE